MWLVLSVNVSLGVHVAHHHKVQLAIKHQHWLSMYQASGGCLTCQRYCLWNVGALHDCIREPFKGGGLPLR